MRAVGRRGRTRPQAGEHGRGRRDADAHAAELGELGFAIALYANAALRCAQRRSAPRSSELLREGTTSGLLDRMATWEERQEAVGKSDYDELERRYARERAVRPPPGRRHRRPARRRRAARRTSWSDDGRIAARGGRPAPQAAATETLDVQRPARAARCRRPARAPRPGHHARRARPRTCEPETAGGGGGRRHHDDRLPDVARALRRGAPSPRAAMDADAAIDFGFHFCISTREQLERGAGATSPTSASARSSSS